MNAFNYVFSAGLVALVVACSGGSDNTGNTSSSSKRPSSSSPSSDSNDETPSQESSPTETTSSKPSGATNVACTNADDCGYWFCDCKDSSGRITPVNGRNCDNGWCMDAATSCPSSCSAFGKTWVGTAGGGPDQK